MNKKAKYNYWHIITSVSQDYQKLHPELEVGLLITHKYPKHNEGVCMFDRTNGKFYDEAYTIDYLGRILKTATNEEISKLTDKWIKEKGYINLGEEKNEKSNRTGY